MTQKLEVLVEEWIKTQKSSTFSKIHIVVNPKLTNFIWKNVIGNTSSNKGSFSMIDMQKDVEDIVAETWVKVIRFYPKYQPELCKFSTWVFSIAINEYRNHFMAKNKYVKLQFASDNDDSSVSKTLDWYMFRENKIVPEENSKFEGKWEELYSKIISDMGATQKQIIIDREINHMNYADIAAKHNQSDNSIKVSIHRIRKNLKTKYLKEYEKVFVD